MSISPTAKRWLLGTLLAIVATVVIGLLVFESYRYVAGRIAARQYRDDPDAEPPLPPVVSYPLLIASLATTGGLLYVLAALLGRS